MEKEKEKNAPDSELEPFMKVLLKNFLRAHIKTDIE